MQLVGELSKRYGNRFQQSLWFSSLFCFISAIVFLATQADHLFPGGAPLLTYHRQAWNSFLYGVDFTILQSLDNGGKNLGGQDVFYMTEDHSEPNDGIMILTNYRVTSMRISVYNDPSKTVGYGSVEEAVKLAQRCKARNVQILLELHFSDNFTDNATQTKPEAWKSLTDRKLTNTLSQWVKSTIKQFEKAEALPDIVSIGHEIENGILFQEGNTNCRKNGGFVGSTSCYQQNMFYYVSLLKSAIKAVRSVKEPPQIMLHTSLANQLYLGRNGADQIIKFYSELNEQWKVAFDIIGLTFYPVLANGCEVSKLQEIKYIYEYFDGRFPIVIAETGYPLTAPKGFNGSYEYSQEGQYLYLRDLIQMCRDTLEGMCTGIFWNPAYVSDRTQLRPWQGPIFDLNEQTPLKVLVEGFAH